MATRRPTCKQCKKRFTTSVKTAVYCSEKCRYAKANVKAKKDPFEKAMKTAFFYYLAGECLRAGTIEILRGHTVDTLSELHSLYKANMRYNGYGDSSQYELSHIAPVKGNDVIGLLYAENLVSTPKSLNRAHGTKHYGCGKAVHRLTLDPRYCVDRVHDKASEVLARVLAYLGEEVVIATIKRCKINPTQRSQLTEWIINHHDSSNPVHVAALPDVARADTLKTRELEHVKAKMLGNDVGEYFAQPATRQQIVFCEELARLSAYRPELGVFAFALEEAWESQATHPGSLFTEHHAQMLFDVLHGKSIAVMADTLEMVIAENTAYSFITYTTNGSGKPRYAVEAFQYVSNPSGGAKLHHTSLAAFKASMVAPVSSAPESVSPVHRYVTPLSTQAWESSPF